MESIQGNLGHDFGIESPHESALKKVFQVLYRSNCY